MHLYTATSAAAQRSAWSSSSSSPTSNNWRGQPQLGGGGEVDEEEEELCCLLISTHMASKPIYSSLLSPGTVCLCAYSSVCENRKSSRPPAAAASTPQTFRFPWSGRGRWTRALFLQTGRRMVRRRHWRRQHGNKTNQYAWWKIDRKDTHRDSSDAGHPLGHLQPGWGLATQ